MRLNLSLSRDYEILIPFFRFNTKLLDRGNIVIYDGRYYILLGSIQRRDTQSYLHYRRLPKFLGSRLEANELKSLVPNLRNLIVTDYSLEDKYKLGLLQRKKEIVRGKLKARFRNVPLFRFLIPKYYSLRYVVRYIYWGLRGVSEGLKRTYIIYLLWSFLVFREYPLRETVRGRAEES